MLVMDTLTGYSCLIVILKKINMATQKKLKAIVLDIYRILYRESTPQADFDELVANATINERGEKEIDFMAYEISPSKFEFLMEAEIKKHKLTKREKGNIRSTIWLGCSPKYKYD